MAKNLKLNIKNTQIAQAVNLGSLKGKLGKKKSETKEEAHSDESLLAKEEKKEEAPKIKARSRSAFADGNIPQAESLHPNLYPETPEPAASEGVELEEFNFLDRPSKHEITNDIEEIETKISPEALRAKLFKDIDEDVEPSIEPLPRPTDMPKPSPRPAPRAPLAMPSRQAAAPQRPPVEFTPREKLGPTGKHIKDLVPPKPPVRQEYPRQDYQRPAPRTGYSQGPSDRAPRDRDTFQRPPSSPGAPRGDYQRGPYVPRTGPRPPGQGPQGPRFQGPSQGQRSSLGSHFPQDRTNAPLKPKVEGAAQEERKPPTKVAPPKFREFRDLKPAKRTEGAKQFDARDKQGLRTSEDDAWRGKRRHKTLQRPMQEETIRPSQLKVRVPISIKDLAEKMKLKASQLVGKLFLQGMVVTLNDLLTDETVIGLLGHEFGCDIQIDTTVEERIRITDKNIREEINGTDPSLLELRPPIVAFMGHVDHGKTSLIDAIRSSNRASGEAGAITQHIGAFRCSTPVGDITILDTPGHEAFSSMRARGADVTDIVVLVVAGDEGIRQQTVEAIQHAKEAKVTIVVAINKCDKPNFNVETVYRQLSEHELLPEAWGGQTITINCSAVTKEGVKELLEMLALQAEVLELRANPNERARGTVIESEMHKGMGSVATVLVQNGTLRIGDSLVFDQHFGKVKTMLNEHNKAIKEAGPATPVSITGLSGLPEAGQEFIVVKSEKEAKEISEARIQDLRRSNLQLTKKVSMDHLMQKASESGKKILTLVLRADVQGSLEALKSALLKIHSNKAEVNIIYAGVGEISESDIQLAAVSKAVIIGFHTQVESHADSLMKEVGVDSRLHDIIYHAVDDVKALMTGMLDKIPQETERGKALVKATFKSSQHGVIAGCQVTEGTIARNNLVRLLRGKDIVWKGSISSLKRVKEDVREVAKGLECGILLAGYDNALPDDIIEAYEITYLTQEL